MKTKSLIIFTVMALAPCPRRGRRPFLQRLGESPAGCPKIKEIIKVILKHPLPVIARTLRGFSRRLRSVPVASNLIFVT